MLLPTHTLAEYAEMAEPTHQFGDVVYDGQAWDLSHLTSFLMHETVNENLTLDVLVIFSCHCFTHAYIDDERDAIPVREQYHDGSDRRVLNPQRYELSRQLLPALVHELRSRRIRVLGGAKQNYLTVEGVDADGHAASYCVFFEVTKSRRKKRLLLHIQSAYPMENLTRRLEEAGKVNFRVLLRAVYEGRTIKA